MSRHSGKRKSRSERPIICKKLEAHICNKKEADYDIIFFCLRKRPAVDDESGPSTSGTAAKKSKGRSTLGDFSSW